MTPFPDIGMTDNPMAAIGPPIHRMPIRQIQIEVCHRFDISLAELLSRRKYPPLAEARHEAMRRAFYETGKPLEHIGREFNRVGKTVRYALDGNQRKKTECKP